MAQDETKLTLGLIDEIRNILFKVWDPLDVNENQNLSDEYNRFADRIAEVVVQKSGAAFISEVLLGYERELSIGAPQERRLKAANMLANLNIDRILH